MKNITPLILLLGVMASSSVAMASPDASISAPEANGLTITWPADGNWYQVQNPSEKLYDVCNSSVNKTTPCIVPEGDYIVINHSDPKKQKTAITVAADTTVAPPSSVERPSVEGDTISWPNDGNWYQVQNPSERNYNVCNSSDHRNFSCVVEDGDYIVIDHSSSPKQRTALTVASSVVVVPNPPAPAPAPAPAPGTTVIDLSGLRQESGHAYHMSYDFGTESDTSGDRGSELRIFENGVEIGPAHSPHSAIRAEGSGRFSHWKGGIYLSASDNSDPRTNGRTYSFAVGEGATNPPVTPEPTPEPQPVNPPVTPEPQPDGEYNVPAQGPLKVFPGAEGFGTDTAAGRGGVICKVTTLEDSRAEGTLRYCAEVLSGPRIVIFEVGGTIWVDERIEIRNSNISIYGQTAPGDGIAVASTEKVDDPILVVFGDNVLIQHMRFRAGDATLYGDTLDKGTSCCRDALFVRGASNVVIDHNSMSWGADEVTGTWFDVDNITFSYNIIAEGLRDHGINNKGPAGRGVLIGDGVDAGNISFHHNYIANSYQRNPLIKVGGVVDIVNNLVNHSQSREGNHSGEYGGTANWVKNKWITGPTNQLGWYGILLSNHFPKMAYFEDNINVGRTDNSQPQLAAANTGFSKPLKATDGYHSETRFQAPSVTEYDVDDLESVLPPLVGATLPKRDSVDTRLLEELRTGGGELIDCVSPDTRGGASGCARNAGGFPLYAGESAPQDTDNDGIPDSWERAHGLNPSVFDSLGDDNSDGYLNIEDWIHSID